jgi:hypothetical protein
MHKHPVPAQMYPGCPLKFCDNYKECSRKLHCALASPGSLILQTHDAYRPNTCKVRCIDPHQGAHCITTYTRNTDIVMMTGSLVHHSHV